MDFNSLFEYDKEERRSMPLKKLIKFGFIIFVFLFFHLECKTQSITALQQENCTIKIFVGDFDQEQLVYREYIIETEDKQEELAFLNRVLKEYPNEEGAYIPALSDEDSILHIRVDLDHDKVYVDMSKTYNQMNYGTLGEYLALQSLAYTIGNYYDVSHVSVTVEKEPYSSGHFYFDQEESILVNTLPLQID